MTDLWEIAKDALNEIYDEAEPGLDFDDLLENTDDYPDDWFGQHTLSAEREQEILQKHKSKHDLTEREKTQLTMTVIVNYGPRSPDN
jgi:hypothetical protein